MWAPLAKYKYVITVSMEPLYCQQNTWKTCRGFLTWDSGLWLSLGKVGALVRTEQGPEAEAVASLPHLAPPLTSLAFGLESHHSEYLVMGLSHYLWVGLTCPTSCSHMWWSSTPSFVRCSLFRQNLGQRLFLFSQMAQLMWTLGLFTFSRPAIAKL